MASGTIHFEDQIQIPSDVFNFEGYTRWLRSNQFPDRGRIAFLDGEVHVDMSPEDLFKHNMVKSEVLRVLLNLSRKTKAGVVFGDGSLLVNAAAHLSTEPDLTFVSYDSLRTGQICAEEWTEGSDRYMQLTGTPDMVLEVVSNGSVRKDTVVLPKLYARAGVAEYWRIDARGTKTVFEILRLRSGKYVRSAPDASGWAKSAVFSLRFRMQRADDPIVGFEYTLEHKNVAQGR